MHQNVSYYYKKTLTTLHRSPTPLAYPLYRLNGLNLSGALHVICHVSHVTCHVSFIIFFGQNGGACSWTVCYQRGLPRLVKTDSQIIYVL